MFVCLTIAAWSGGSVPMHSAYSGQLPGRQVFLDLKMGGALVLLKQNQDLANGGDTRFHILHQHINGKAEVP